VTLLLLLTSPIIVLEYFDKERVIFGNILIVVFELYLLSIGVTIVRGVLVAPKPKDSLDDDSDNDINNDDVSNDNNDNNSRDIASMRPNKYNESTSNKNEVPMAKISFASSPFRISRHFSRHLRSHVF